MYFCEKKKQIIKLISNFVHLFEVELVIYNELQFFSAAASSKSHQSFVQPFIKVVEREDLYGIMHSFLESLFMCI